MTVYDLPHIASIEPIGTSGAYRIRMEHGYWIHKPAYGENVWKTVGFINPGDDLTTIQIVAEADLPEGAELCGSVKPETETM